MQSPTVSFVVPCYNLAHLLRQCVDSILSQSFRDLEVLIMDDCSPDDTAGVVRSIADPRVTHVRNDPNLGHLRNYNKGIGLARGRYVWLISADDYLRRPYVLEKYVGVLESHPEAAYAYCPAVDVRDGEEIETVGWSVLGGPDRVMPGHALLKKLLQRNYVAAASGMVRRECYERLGGFPLDFPWAGDWYLWCLFALHGSVAYFEEPMVCYRGHESNMTSQLRQAKVDACKAEELAILERIRGKADEAGFRAVSRDCARLIAWRRLKLVLGRNPLLRSMWLAIRRPDGR